MKSLYLSTALLVLASAACDEGTASDEYVEPLVTLSGTVSYSGTQALPEDIHVAFVWQAPLSGIEGPIVFISQDVSIETSFPVSFSLDVFELPPPEAIDPMFGRATGYVVVYEDKNGNGELDLTPVGADDFVDRLLGYPLNTEVRYQEAGIQTDAPIGFSFGHYDVTEETFEGTHLATVVPIDEPLSIELFAEEVSSCHLLTPSPGRDYDETDGIFDLGPFGFSSVHRAECPGGVTPVDWTKGCTEDGGLFATKTLVPASPHIAQLCGELEDSCFSQEPAPGECP